MSVTSFPRRPGGFPSLEHRQALCERVVRPGGFNNLSHAERIEYHAYDYGWRRVSLHQTGPGYPLDPDGEHYNARLADQAEQLFRRGGRRVLQSWEPGFADGYDEQSFKNFSSEKQQRIKDEDKNRVAADKAFRAGSMSKDDFVTLCCDQIRALMKDAPLLRGPWHQIPDRHGVRAFAKYVDTLIDRSLAGPPLPADGEEEAAE
jgi:hypothetical protein